MTNQAPTATTCRVCHREYDPLDADAVERHTVRINNNCCTRCRDRPSCYFCQGMFCNCSAH